MKIPHAQLHKILCFLDDIEFLQWNFKLSYSFHFTEYISNHMTLLLSGVFFLYALLCIIGSGLLAVILPETKGKSLEEIVELFEKRWNFGLFKL